MSHGDPTMVANQLKRAAALTRDARMVLRRLDRLAAEAGDDPVRRDLESLRDACERMVARLAQREHTLQRQAREAVRRVR